MARIFPSLTRSFRRGILFSLCAVAVTAANQPSVPKAPTTGGELLAARVYYPEARLRKMHLVRPDLILYPIFYAVYC